MKFSEDVLTSLNLEPLKEKEPVNIMKISEMLDFMKKSSERIFNKSKLYVSIDDSDIKADCVDIVATKINDFTQVFMDLVVFIRRLEKTYTVSKASLRYCSTSYETFGFSLTDAERKFLDELLLRNEITHDYFNREIHQQKLIAIMENYSVGALDIYDNLLRYCQDHNYMDLYANNSYKR